MRLPLNALLAFEATARHGSMSAAAAELGVTHGAVSRHVRGLEARFGVPLLRRLSHAVEATPAGAQLARALGEGFARLRQGVARLEPGPLTLSCSATIMNHWLIPRLSRFKAAHPGVEIRLHVSHGEVDFLRDEVSLAIRSSMVRPPAGLVARPLLREEIGPVCHPELVREAALRAPADLARLRLLGSATRPAAWEEWVAAAGHAPLRLEAQERFEHFYLLIQAAACGLGVGIAPRFLVEDAVARGHLAAPLGFVRGPHELSLWIAPHLRNRAELRLLAGWIEAEMAPPCPAHHSPGTLAP